MISVDKGLITPDGFIALNKRGITKDTCVTYGVQVWKDREEYKLVFPFYDNEGKLIGQKVKSPDKRFMWKGESPGTNLFGQQLFQPKSAKFITITEGEEDALAAFQMLGSKWPVVSIRNGAQGGPKDIKKNWEYITSFDKIVICFDNDEPGKKAAKACAELLPPKKVKIVNLSRKDANDYLIAGDTETFVKDWWNASTYTPEGIVAAQAIKHLVKDNRVIPSIPYPWEGLNNLTFGIRKGELVTITAGSGLGKSAVMREIVYHLIHQTSDNIGLMFMEENTKKTCQSLLSLHVNKPLHIPGNEIDDDTFEKAWSDIFGSDRLYLFDHFGSNNIDTIVSKVRQLVRSYDCKYIFLDHLSIIVSSQENGDERKALDEITTKLRTLVQELDICLFMVCHSKRPNGKAHEEGGQTSLSELRGSAGIAQLSDLVFGIERDGQAKDEVKRNTTIIRVLKNRPFGFTGESCTLFYDKITGRLQEVYQRVEEIESEEIESVA
jgi:twinkle protein